MAMDRTTEMLRSLVCDLNYNDLTPQTVHQTKRVLVDTLPCAMGGYLSEPAKIARQLASSVKSDGENGSRILGTRDSSSPEMAGFANSVMVRYLDYNDMSVGGHPSDSIPGPLAVAYPRGSDGRAVITSIVVNYEVARRVGSHVQHTFQLGWDHGILRALGAACAAGKIMGLDHERMGHAISLAVVPNLSLGQTRVGELSMWKDMAGPQGTKAGIFAAQLAECGVTGPFEPFDGSEGLWAKMLGHPVQLQEDGWGEPYSINETRLKFFPSQGGTQGPTGLAVELYSQVSREEIEAIHLEIPEGLFHRAVREPEKWNPQTRETADHSIPYLVAVALHDEVVTPASFNPQRIHDPALRALISNMTIEPNPDFSRRYPDEVNCRLAVTTGSGRTHVAQGVYPKGFPQHPMSDADVEAKFRSCCADLLTAHQCDQALALLWSLEAQPNLQALFDNLVV